MDLFDYSTQTVVGCWLLLISLLLLIYWTGPRWELMKIHHRTPYPIIGHLPYMPRSLSEVIPLMRRECEAPGANGVTYSYVFGFHYVFLSSPEAVETVLKSRTLLAKGEDYDVVRPWLGSGLLVSSGSLWHSRRKLLTRAFHFSILDQLLPVIVNHTRLLVRRLQEAQLSEEVSMWPLVSNATLDIICAAAMGVDIGAQQGDESQYQDALETLRDIAIIRTLQPWLRNQYIFSLSAKKKVHDQALEVLHGFTSAVIQRRKLILQEQSPGSEKQTAEDCSKSPLTFLDMLLTIQRNGERISDSDIRDEVDTFVFEGHDTTACAINWTLFMLGHHPHEQERVREEVEAVLTDCEDKELTRDDLGRMTYLDCVIKESLRLYPPAPLISRTATETTNIMGYSVPAGTEILMNTFMIHRRREHWPDPDRFDPERFSPDKTADQPANTADPVQKQRHPYSYIPFSAGPRNCIGQRFASMELKVILANLIRNFRIESQEPIDDIVFIPSLTLQKQGKMRLRVTPTANEAASNLQQ